MAETLERDLAYWINEREEVRRSKEYGAPKPWSRDPVFQETYFCNVRREDDKVTRWIAENWRNQWPHENYELAMAMARFINKPESLDILGFPSLWKVDDYLRRFREIPGVKWGSAYVITTHGQKMDKDTYVFEALDAMYPTIRGARELETCQSVWEFLTLYDGLGPFLSAQLVADFKNTEGHPLRQAEDYHRFVAPGPGSLRGLSWFWGEKITNSYFHTAIYEAYDLTMPHVLPSMRGIHMQDFQNCLCEFDKYMRVREGTGRSKRRYPGTA